MKNHRPGKEKLKLKDLGRVIERHFKDGMNKVEEIFKDDQKADDKLFSYFKAFVDDKGVASVTPSSRFLVERVVKAMDPKTAKVIVEYGAASGPITRRALEKMPSDGRLFAIELNDSLFEALTAGLKDPRLTAIHGDARFVDQLLGPHGIENGSADVVFSGIPFAFLSGRGRHELLTKTLELLRPGGRFVAYQVTTHLIPMLKDYFPRIDTQFEVRNIPPHFIFTAYK